MATRNLTQQIVDHLQARPDRIVTLNELDEHFAAFSRQTIASSISHMKPRFPQLEYRGAGCYLWNSAKIVQPARDALPPVPDEMIVRVLAMRDDGYLVQDDERKTLYVMRPLKW